MAIDRVFGSQRPAAEEYVGWLADQGVQRGLLGPREVDRLWERHLLNCAVVAEAIPPGVAVRDVGSGAGLPGVAIALIRPDLRIELIEPLLRRATFLTETVQRLGLTGVTVTRARAEDLWGAARVEIVTARAVAPIHRLAGWCLPLLLPGGSLVALKGARVHAELASAQDDLRRLGAHSWQVTEYGGEILAQPTTVLRVQLGPAAAGRPRAGRDRPR